MTAAEVVDLAGDVVLIPGLVDTHVHVNEPGHADWEGFGPATRAAAAGGVTTLVDMPVDSVPVTVDVATHYLTLTAERIPDGATEFACSPPIRGAADRDGLWAGLAGGTIGLKEQI
jgi:dihydroorotase-like cyclic amidohydrolase